MKKSLILLFLFFFINLFSQKTNPIVFIEGFITIQQEEVAGFSLNYQSKNSLFTYRYSYLEKSRVKYLLAIPVYKKLNQAEEFSLMYGYRKSFDVYSLSFSMGVSYNIFKDYSLPDNNEIEKSEFGFPIELSIKYFKKEKKQYRLFFLFPVGKSTGFSRSIGMKIVANISKYGYYGIALTYGFGWHKTYE